MTLAHEIAINPDFRLEPYIPPENSLEKKIKTILHDAFWDLLREQLNSDPPCYDHAIVLLGDIKEVASTTQIIQYIEWFNSNLVISRDSRTSFPRTIKKH